MNAAFLLVTGAMLVGQGGDKKTATPPPAQPAPAPVATSCGTTDPCGCEGFGHRLRERLGGLFHRNNCDSCQPTTCNDHTHRPLFNRGCDDGCKPKFWNFQHGCRDNSCATPTCTDSCGGHSFNLLSNLRHRFGRNDCGCDGGCASTTAAPAVTTPPAKGGEKIDPPAKKLPTEPKKVPEKKVNEEVRIEPQAVRVTPVAPVAPAPPIAPIAPSAVQPLPAPPTVDITPVPVPVPRVEGDRRDPF